MQVFEKIRNWARDRELTGRDRLHAQMVKLMEEVGELSHAVCRLEKYGQMDKAKDAIGDCVVVLTILAEQLGMSIEDCIDSAYEQIANRKGNTVNGVFVKENE